MSEELLCNQQVSLSENKFLHFKTWRHLFLEGEIHLPITNKDEIIMRCHNALELKTRTFILISWFRTILKEFLDYFSQDYPHFMQEVQKAC